MNWLVFPNANNISNTGKYMLMHTCSYSSTIVLLM